MQQIPVAKLPIKLGQFLKLSGLADSGSDAHLMLDDEAVTVNGEVELRRGRQLHKGDVVSLAGHEFEVA